MPDGVAAGVTVWTVLSSPVFWGSQGFLGLIWGVVAFFLKRRYSRQLDERLAKLTSQHERLKQFAGALDDKLWFANHRMRLFKGIVEDTRDLPRAGSAGFQDKLSCILRRILGHVAQMCSGQASPTSNSYRAAILNRESDGSLTCREACGYTAAEMLERLGPGSIAGQCCTSGNVTYSADAFEDDCFADQPHSSKEFRAVLAVPVSVKENRSAVLKVGGAKIDCIKPDDRDVITFAARLIELCLAFEASRA